MKHKEKDFLDRLWDRFKLYPFKHRIGIMVVLILLQIVIGNIVYGNF